MPSPSSTLASLRPDLAGSLQEFALDMASQGFVGLQVAPVVEVDKPTGNRGVIPIEELLKPVDTRRAPGSEYKRAHYTFTADTFACEEHGVEEPVDRREAAMYRDYFDAELLAAQRARRTVMASYEARVAALVQSTSTWTGSLLTTAVSTPWSTTASATPLDDVENAKLLVFANSGLIANALIVGWKTYKRLRLNTTSNQIVDRIKACGLYNPALKYLSAAVLAELFDVRYFIVAGAVYNSAAEGQTFAGKTIWSNDRCMVARIAETSDPREPCIARTFHWGEDGSTIGGLVESYYDERCRSDVVRCRMDTDEVIMYPEAGHLLTNVNNAVA